ncbi:MAG: anthranilate phosphoribosyltransferase [Alphaproteobacteria bacterium]|nr:anthranilate phosphoribosyltransferase [Alphaproteobacteria bacterium]
MSEAAPDLKPLLAHIAAGRTLSEKEAEAAFDIIMSGNATAAQIGAFLMGLRVRGESVDEITAGARIMRRKALAIEAPAGAIDTCGTGGDNSGTLNISTATALVVAAAGVPVAKHGNRSLSSRSGSADVLTALGVDIQADMSLVRQCLWENRIGFLMAPRHHGAMRHVAAARVELGTRTIFNLLGPLSNPAGAKRQLVGVFAEEWVEPLARVLGNLGAERAWVVHGGDGLDELTTTGPSHVAEYYEGRVRRFTVTPADAGLPLGRSQDLKGGDPAENAAALRALLAGQAGAYRDIVLLNSAAALLVAGAVPNLVEGVARARAAIDGGQAAVVLAELVAITNTPPGARAP